MKAMTSGALITLLGVSYAAAVSMTRDLLAPLGAPSRPAPAPVKPVTETLWGKQVTDNYRYMEALDPSTIAWMKAQGAYTRSILDAIPPRAALEAKVATFPGSFGFTRGYVNYGGRAFYELSRGKRKATYGGERGIHESGNSANFHTIRSTNGNGAVGALHRVTPSGLTDLP
jgi:hypothetical protein